MRRAERVVFALRAPGEAGQPAALAQRADAVAPAGEDLVRIGLVADVPDQPVARACRTRRAAPPSARRRRAQAPRWPPVTDTASIVSARSSSATCSSCSAEKLRRSDGTRTRSSIGVVGRQRRERINGCVHDLGPQLQLAAPGDHDAASCAQQVGLARRNCPGARPPGRPASRLVARPLRPRARPPGSPCRRPRPCRRSCRVSSVVPLASSRSSAIWNAAPRSRP